MRAWQLGELKGYEGLVFSERPVPEPGVGEVVVRVHASGLNYRDLGFPACPRKLCSSCQTACLSKTRRR
jgi:D-arabinose 1-dehydrogenase-like Zn-dependent alcohol dehydrogenase